MYFEQEREIVPNDAMQGAYLGPEFSDLDVENINRKYNAKATYFSDFNELTKKVAQHISQGNAIGWMQGRMEFGPRALGNRSIIGDPRNQSMQSQMNLKIKQRESFRPFAPAVLEEDVETFFDIDRPSPYMLLGADVKGSPVNSEIYLATSWSYP